MNPKLKLAKKATRYVVGYGTGLIITGTVISHVAPKNLVQKIAVVVAGTVIIMAGQEKIGEYCDAKFDEAVDAVKNMLKKEEEGPKTVEA
jgi:hypothetical protein